MKFLKLLRKFTKGKHMEEGTVKFFNAEKGFGFLSRQDQPDVFLHRFDLPQGVTVLKPGTKLMFDLGDGLKGQKKAINVKLGDK